MRTPPPPPPPLCKNIAFLRTTYVIGNNSRSFATFYRLVFDKVFGGFLSCQPIVDLLLFLYLLMLVLNDFLCTQCYSINLTFHNENKCFLFSVNSIKCRLFLALGRIFTARIRSMTGRYCFHRCLSVNISGGGYPVQVWMVGGIPHPRSGQSGGTPSQVWLGGGGYPIPGLGGTPSTTISQVLG